MAAVVEELSTVEWKVMSAVPPLVSIALALTVTGALYVWKPLVVNVATSTVVPWPPRVMLRGSFGPVLSTMLLSRTGAPVSVNAKSKPLSW